MNHLERALDNQNQWWKYLLIILAGLVAANTIGAIPLMIVMFSRIFEGTVSPASDNIADLSVYGLHPNLSLVLLIFPFVIGLLTVILMLKPLHKRTWKEVVNGTTTVRWSRFFYGAFIWIIIMALYLIVFYLADPGNFKVSFKADSFAVLVVISLLLIPFQTTYEELVFRGYLSQGLAYWTRSRWVVLLVPAFLFGLMHYFNPEVKEFGFWLTMPQYWLFGLLFGLLTVLDDGIEIAMGVHTANNVFTSVMVTHKASVLQTPALLTQNKVDPLQDTLLFVLMGIILIIVLARKYQWDFSVLNEKVQKEQI